MGRLRMDLVKSAIEEIRSHHKVAGYRLQGENELEINFNGNYKDLVIPLSPKMDYDKILTVFYYYVANFWGK